MSDKKHNITKGELDAHLKGVKTFTDENVYNAIKQRNTAWKINFWLVVLLTLTVLAIVLLTPLKTVEPYVIKVEETTGIVEVLKPLSDGAITQDEAVTKYFIGGYMNCREQYTRFEANLCYEKVRAFSNSEVFREYHAWFAPNNPQSPINVYKASGSVDIVIKSIAFLNDTTANIRYRKIEKDVTGTQKVSHWITTLTFKYVKTPATEQERLVNPLGFIVTSYRNDPEA